MTNEERFFFMLAELLEKYGEAFMDKNKETNGNSENN